MAASDKLCEMMVLISAWIAATFCAYVQVLLPELPVEPLPDPLYAFAGAPETSGRRKVEMETSTAERFLVLFGTMNQ